jgi:ribosomal protein L31E
MTEEKILKVNLRQQLAGKPSWKVKQTAARMLRQLLAKHVKSKVKISVQLNKAITKGKKRFAVKLVKKEDAYEAEPV